MFHFRRYLSFVTVAMTAAFLFQMPSAWAAPEARSHKSVRAAAAGPSPKKLLASRKSLAVKKMPAKKTTPAYGRVPTPPDSYLRYKVYTVPQLVAQVQADPRIRKIYARHFNIPEARVVSYMRANLVESYVPKTGKYKVYCVHRNGQIYSVRQTFRKGTKVFALRNGEPVMKWVCGNPLSTKLPPTKVTPVTEQVGQSIETLTPSDLADVFVPSELAPVAVAPILAGPTILGAAPIFFGGGAGLSALGLLFPIGVIIGSGGGGGGSHPPPSSLPVPEPNAPVVLLALTLTVGMGLTTRKFAKRHQTGK